MQSSPSSSCSHSLSSSSSSSLAARYLTRRLENIFKKAYELSTLCDVEACVIYYGPEGELKTWPEDREKVKDISLRYIKLDEAKRRTKSVDLDGFLEKNKKKMTNVQKKTKTNVKGLKYPISDHYSRDQISQLIQSLDLNYSKLQERRSFLEAQKHQDHKGLTPSSLKHQDHHQTQSLNPSKFSLVMYNHEDATLSLFPLSASNFNQLTNYSAVQESGLENQDCDQQEHISTSLRL